MLDVNYPADDNGNGTNYDNADKLMLVILLIVKMLMQLIEEAHIELVPCRPGFVFSIAITEAQIYRYMLSVLSTDLQ